MVRIDILRDDDHKRILRCSEGNRLWCIEIQKYYVYEVRNGRRIIWKNKIKEILDILL